MKLSINNTKRENMEAMREYKMEINNIPFYKRYKVINNDNGVLINNEINVHIPFLSLKDGIELPIMYRPKYMAYTKQIFACVGNFPGIGTAILVDDMFMSLPVNYQLATIYHELGHLNKLHIADTRSVIKYMTDLKYYARCEFEADEYAASLIGFDQMIKTLKMIYKHSYLLRFSHKSKKNYIKNKSFIKERIYLLENKKERHA